MEPGCRDSQTGPVVREIRGSLSLSPRTHSSHRRSSDIRSPCPSPLANQDPLSIIRTELGRMLVAPILDRLQVCCVCCAL